MAKNCGPMESKETPKMEAMSHSKLFLGKAKKLAEKKGGKKEMKKKV